MIKEISHFYDNQYDENKGLLEIDRIYLLDTESFSQELWEELVLNGSLWKMKSKC